MTVFKAFLSSRLFLAVSLAASWGLVLAVALSLYPGAWAMTKASRLIHLTKHPLFLAAALQQERAIAAGVAATVPAGKFAARVPAALKRTDESRQAFEGDRERFNRADFGPELADTLGRAHASLAGLDRFRTGVKAGQADAQAVIEYYSKPLGHLSAIIYQLEPLHLQDAAAARFRDAYTTIVRLNGLAAREMAIGLVIAAGGAGPELAEQWLSLPDEERALRRRYHEVSGAAGGEDSRAWDSLPSWQTLERLQARLRASPPPPGLSGEAVTPAAWFEAALQKHIELSGLAAEHREKLMARTGMVASLAGHAFAGSLLIACLATFAVIVRIGPARSRHAFFALVIVFNAAIAAWALAAGTEWVAHEGGPIEMLQVLSLVAAFALYCAEAWKYPNPARPGAVLLACVCFFIFYRELDLRVFGAPAWITAGPIADSDRAAFWAALALMTAYAAYSLRSLVFLARRSLTSRAWPFFVWPVLLVAAVGIEEIASLTRKDGLPGYWADGRLWEELLEFDAYLALLFAAWIFGGIFRKADTGKP